MDAVDDVNTDDMNTVIDTDDVNTAIGGEDMNEAIDADDMRVVTDVDNDDHVEEFGLWCRQLDVDIVEVAGCWAPEMSVTVARRCRARSTDLHGYHIRPTKTVR